MNNTVHVKIRLLSHKLYSTLNNDYEKTFGTLCSNVYMQLKKISLTYTGNVLHTSRFHLIRNEKPHHLLKSRFSQALPEATAKLYCLSYYHKKSAAQTTTNELWRNWSHRQWLSQPERTAGQNLGSSSERRKSHNRLARHSVQTFSIWLNHATETDVSSFPIFPRALRANTIKCQMVLGKRFANICW